jgi:Predicted nucleotide-binding protein containing TIR -like domain
MFVNNQRIHKKNIETINSIIKDIETNKSEYIATLSSSKIKRENRELSVDKVFIIHGHDHRLKNEVARFLEKLGIKPIILHGQVNTGKTIIEKLEHYSDVGFGIVLHTPCDIQGVSIKPEKLNPRTRQNDISRELKKLAILLTSVGMTTVF